MKNILDLDRFPLDRPDSTEWQTLVAQCRADLAQHGMFNLAYEYAREDMSAYVKLQEQEFADADKGYTFVAHQQEVGTGYFDDVTTVIQGGKSSVTALTGSTEEAQFG